MPPYQRKIPTTGYWEFVCNTNIWAADKFLATGEDELWYRISEHHQREFKPNQFGVLRLNEDRRSKKKLEGRPALHAGIYAICQVIDGKPRFAIDEDIRFNYNAEEASDPHHQIRLRIVANLLRTPVLASRLPHTKDFQYIHTPLSTSTIALSRSAFQQIALLSGWSQLSSSTEPLVDTPAAVFLIEDELANSTPEQKLVASRRIERGPVGNAVKAYHNYRCQVCDALKRDSISFIDRSGKPFAEAHHIIPVSRLVKGSLSHLNIMALCPNHHRQAHYGNFQVTDEEDHWVVQVDGTNIRITKARLGPSGEIAVDPLRRENTGEMGSE